jgi:radical SAM protein with 4Fe4S-binding SPASM domain
MRGIEKNAPPTDPAELIASIRTTGLHPPEQVTLMVTDGCNLRCGHCLLECRSPQPTAPVPARRVEGAIDGFARMGVARVTLTGGELLTHPAWHRLIAFGLAHPRIRQVCLQTNATCFSPAQFDLLMTLPAGKLRIQISLDGATAAVHERVRGNGSFAPVMDALARLVAAGWGEHIRVAFTEMEHNMDELPALLEMAERMGIGQVVSGTLVCGGRAAATNTLRPPTPAQYRDLIRRYTTDPAFQRRVDERASIAAVAWWKHRHAAGDPDCACLKDLFVNAQGEMFPCTMLLVDRFAAAGVYTHPVETVIHDALLKWREIPQLHRQRRRMLGACAGCSGWLHCGGGCMGRAAAADGDLMAPDDRCALRKAVYQT